MCVGSRVECREAQDVVCACVYAEDRAMRGCGREGVVLVVRLHGTTFFFLEGEETHERERGVLGTGF